MASRSRHGILKQDVVAYHLLSEGKLGRFPLPSGTAVYGQWILRDGKLQQRLNGLSRQETGFRWDGEKFVPLAAQAVSRSQAPSKLDPDDLSDENDGDEDAAFIAKSERKAFKDAGSHYKFLTGYESKESNAVLPMVLGKHSFNLTLSRSLPASPEDFAYDPFKYGVTNIELSGDRLEPPTQILWTQKGWQRIAEADYRSLAGRYGHRISHPITVWIWLMLFVALGLYKFSLWGRVLFGLATAKSKVVSNMATSYSFPPATPAQFPLLDMVSLDRYTREFESMGFTQLLDFSLVADKPSHAPSFCRLLVHTRHHCFAEVSQLFPRGKKPMALKCAILSDLQSGWSLSFSDRKPLAASSLIRRKKALGVCMPEGTTAELLQAFLRMRDQVCIDLGISPVGDDTLDAYMKRVQRTLTEMRDAVRQKNFAVGLSQFCFRKFSLLKTKPEYVWLGDYPKEAERLRQGFAMGVSAT